LEGRKPDGTIVRNDTGVFEGGEISMYYDPMVAKLCTWGPDRITAIDAMSEALDDFEVEGIGHNLPFLSAVMQHERFRSGKITTAFIAEEFPEGFSGVAAKKPEVRKLAAVAAFVNHVLQSRAVRISGTIGNHQRIVGRDWVVTFAGGSHELSVDPTTSDTTVSFADGSALSIASDWQPGQQHAHFDIDGETVGVKVSKAAGGTRLRWRGIDEIVHVRAPRIAHLAALMPVKQAADTSKLLLCPMPGIVTSIAVQEGDQVEAGQSLATVEAMKMENTLRAEKRGTVKRVRAAAGQSLAVDEVIMEFE
jgi:propionyl-CoA carboxylase alpha chain